MKARQKIDSPYRPDRYARRLYGKKKQEELEEAGVFSDEDRIDKKEKQRRNRRFRRTTGQMDIKSGRAYKKLDE